MYMGRNKMELADETDRRPDLPEDQRRSDNLMTEPVPAD